jgi:hypothetical protein
VADHTAVLQRIVTDVGMAGEDALPFEPALTGGHADVATDTAVGDTERRYVDLSKLEVEVGSLRRW